MKEEFEYLKNNLVQVIYRTIDNHKRIKQLEEEKIDLEIRVRKLELVVESLSCGKIL